MTANRLHPEDKVLVEIYSEEKKVDAYEGTGFHNIEQAVQQAYDNSHQATMSIEDYAFRVTNLTDQTTARYRVNAGGNVKVIPEE